MHKSRQTITERCNMLSKLKAIGAKACNTPTIKKSVDFLIDSKNYYAANPREGLKVAATVGFAVWVGDSLDDIEDASEVSAYVDATDYVGRHG
tara:strand:+ start:31 stop:309 length:279 start_codon:yes stop_codon:yes gene_type:complete